MRHKVGDLSAEVKKRTKARVLDFTGKDDWHFGDIAKEVNSRRQEWAKGYLGEEAWENYETGDFTKKVLHDLKAFKDDYSVGDSKCCRFILRSGCGQQSHQYPFQ